MLTKTESSGAGVGAISFLQELRSPGLEMSLETSLETETKSRDSITGTSSSNRRKKMTAIPGRRFLNKLAAKLKLTLLFSIRVGNPSYWRFH